MKKKKKNVCQGYWTLEFSASAGYHTLKNRHFNFADVALFLCSRVTLISIFVSRGSLYGNASLMMYPAFVEVHFFFL